MVGATPCIMILILGAAICQPDLSRLITITARRTAARKTALASERLASERSQVLSNVIEGAS